MLGVQFGETGSRRRNALNHIRDRREGVHRANNELVQLSVISYQANPFAIALGHHSVSSSHGTMMPEAMYLEISELAGS